MSLGRGSGQGARERVVPIVWMDVGHGRMRSAMDSEVRT